jgi:Cdc6-like AAA superfamily ATPase
MVKNCAESFDSDNVDYSFIKATDIQSSPKDIFVTIANMVGKKCSSKDVDQVEKLLSYRKKGRPLFLIIDEVDFLLSSNSTTKSEIARVLQWGSDPNNRLAVIGISNSVGDDNAKYLHHNFSVSVF